MRAMMVAATHHISHESLGRGSHGNRRNSWGLLGLIGKTWLLLSRLSWHEQPRALRIPKMEAPTLDSNAPTVAYRTLRWIHFWDPRSS